MYKYLTAAALGCGLLAAPASAITLDLSNGTFDNVNGSWFFDDIATVGGNNVNLSVATVPGLVTSNESFNEQFDTNYFQSALSSLPAGNASVFNFSFVDDALNAFTVANVEIGVFDLDYDGREVVRTNDAVSVTVTANTDLTVTTGLGFVEVAGADGNTTNPSDFTSLTAAQQDSGVTFDFGTTDSFSIEAVVVADAGNAGGRAFYFGNLSFTSPTTTTSIAPVPVPPAMAMMLLGLGGLVGLRRMKRAA